jgi:DNA repair exonuclease SbcCD ATPase subunit
MLSVQACTNGKKPVNMANTEDQEMQEQLEGINKRKESTSTITFRTPTWLKAKVLETADSKGLAPSGYVAYTIYKAVVQGMVSKSDYDQLHEKWESEANLHKQAIKDLEELKKKNKELESQLKQAKSNDTKRSELEKQVKQKDKEISQLNKRVEEVTNQRDESKQKHKDEVKKLKEQLSHKDQEISELEQEKNNALGRIKKANQWIKDNTGGFLGLDDPGRF